MGHLINPVAFRLGWLNSWEFEFFCKNLYYPQYLHLMFKYRLFVVYLLTTYRCEQVLGVIFSHVEFFKKGRILQICIFTYQSFIENCTQEFVYFEFWFLKNLIPNKLNFYDLQQAQKFVLFYFIYYIVIAERHTILESWDFSENFRWTSSFKKFIRSWNSLNDEVVVGKFLQMNSNLDCKMEIFIWFFSFRYLMLVNKLSWWEGLLDFIYFYFSLKCLGLFFSLETKKIYFIGQYVFNTESFVSWYRVGNNEVTPKFLARFLCKKLRQNFGVKALLNPIRRELQILMSELHESHLELNLKNQTNLKIWNKEIFKQNLFSFFKLFNVEWAKFAKINKNWVPLDYWTFLFKIYKNTKISNINRIKFLYKFLLFRPWIYIWHVIGKNNLSNNYFWKPILYNLKSYYSVNFVHKLMNIINIPFLYSSIVFCQHFFNYMWMEIWKQVILIFNLNKLKLRKKIVLRDDNKFGLSGFKIQFVGRFSRKQRASSIFVQHGCMPLNTLCANINFGSDTIALRNSAITVKIWFYYTNFIYSPYSMINNNLFN